MHRILSHIEQVLQAETLKKDIPGSPPKRIPIADQQRILDTDIREILAGRTEIYDPRERPPREG
jgi:hypothetical protein